jgi:hypothetical protein
MIVAAQGWDEGVAALKLAIRGLSERSTLEKMQVVIEGQGRDSNVWDQIGFEKAYDLNPNDLSFKILQVPMTGDLSRIRLRISK